VIVHYVIVTGELIGSARPSNFTNTWLCEEHSDDPHRGLWYEKKAEGTFTAMRDLRDKLNGDKAR
jgi:hypothetical protein